MKTFHILPFHMKARVCLTYSVNGFSYHMCTRVHKSAQKCQKLLYFLTAFPTFTLWSKPGFDSRSSLT